MKTYTFTFGSSHMKDGQKKCVKVDAKDEAQARRLMMGHYGTAWCACYKDASVLADYDLEVIKKITPFSLLKSFVLECGMTYKQMELFDKLVHLEGVSYDDILGGCDGDVYFTTLFNVTISKANYLQQMQRDFLNVKAEGAQS